MKKILVTGACEPGIGEAITRSLLSAGYAVIGTHEPATPIPTFNEQERANLTLVPLEHSSRASVENFCGTIKDGPLHGFINSQMYFHVEDLDPFDIDLWEKSISVNLTMPTIIFRTLVNSLISGSSVVLISSTEGFMGSFGASAYAASKAAIHNLVKTWANLSGEQNVRVNAIAAGWIGGVMDTDDVFNLSREITPLGRLGHAAEIANVVHFLIEERSSFVNGSVVTVDGGYSGVDRIAKFEFERSSEPAA